MNLVSVECRRILYERRQSLGYVLLTLLGQAECIRIDETARGQLMTYTRQFLVSHTWNNPIFSHPTRHPHPHRVSKSTQPTPTAHDSVSKPTSTQICLESKCILACTHFHVFYPDYINNFVSKCK